MCFRADGRRRSQCRRTSGPLPSRPRNASRGFPRESRGTPSSCSPGGTGGNGSACRGQDCRITTSTASERLRVRDVDILPNEVRFSRSCEVDGDTVEELRHFGNGLRRVIPIGHEDVDESSLASEHPDVTSELDEDGRLIVRVREALAPLFQGHAHDILRLDLDTFDFTALTDVTVLAIVAQPVTTRRRDTEDLRSGPEVRHRFLFYWIDVPGDHTTVHVQPQLPFVDAANAAEANLALPNFAVPRAGGAHDLVRPLDRFPQFRDFAHRAARRLADVEDFLLRNHRRRDTAPPGAKYFVNRLPNRGRTEVFPALAHERFLPCFSDQHVATRGGDRPNHGEALAARRCGGPALEKGPDRVRPDCGEEF